MQLFVQRLNWYRNIDSKVFHQQSPDWIRSGRAICGRRIASPSHVLNDPDGPVPAYATRCKACLKREQ